MDMDRRSEHRSKRARRAQPPQGEDESRIHPELVGMLYATLDSGRRYAWLRLRIPGRSNLRRIGQD